MGLLREECSRQATFIGFGVFGALFVVERFWSGARQVMGLCFAKVHLPSLPV